MRITIDDRKFIWLALIVAAIFVRHTLIAALLPFILALLLSAVIEPGVTFLENRARMPRPVATLVALLTTILAGGYVALVVATKVLSELVQLGSLLQRYQQVPVDLATRLIEELNRLNEILDQRQLPQTVQDNILQAVDDLTTAGIGLLTQGINLTLNAATKVPALIVILVITVIATYFILKDKDSLVESILRVLPEGIRSRARAAQQRMADDLLGFVKASLILLSLTTFVIAVGLIIVGVNYWMTLALIAGLLDIIPVLGPGFLMVPWAVGAWILGSPALAIKLLLIYSASFLIRQMFQAKILGDFIGVHPLPMLVALYAGIHFFGFEGIVVAPLLVILVKAVYSLTARP